MADAEAPPQKKEAAVLTDASLAVLAGAVGDCLKLAMYLNVPNTAVVNHKIDGDAKGFTEAQTGTKLLKYWKTNVRCSAKEREKVADMERALRDMVNHEIADAFSDRHRDTGRELTEDFIQ